jgi:hypothetical protein
MTPKDVPFSTLVGKTLVAIEGLENESEQVVFKCSDGSEFKMFHDQDCCETVTLVDVDSEDVPHLVGHTITEAETASFDAGAANVGREDGETWTFYKISANYYHMTLRWLGRSNGYYSERVDFVQTAEAAVPTT